MSTSSAVAKNFWASILMISKCAGGGGGAEVMSIGGLTMLLVSHVHARLQVCENAMSTCSSEPKSFVDQHSSSFQVCKGRGANEHKWPYHALALACACKCAGVCVGRWV